VIQSPPEFRVIRKRRFTSSSSGAAAVSVDQINLPLTRRETSINHRLLGTLGMIGSPMLLAEIILFGLIFKAENPNNQIAGLLEIIYLGGWVSSAIGLRQLRVTGDNILGKAVFVIQLTGLSLALIFSAQGIINPNSDPHSLLFRISDAAWPLSHLFMLIVGVLVLKAKVWRGWRRVTPILCGLALPVYFAVNATVGREAGGIIFGVSTTVAFMLLGHAVRTTHTIDQEVKKLYG
jgi:hypothetical protein